MKKAKVTVRVRPLVPLLNLKQSKIVRKTPKVRILTESSSLWLSTTIHYCLRILGIGLGIQILKYPYL